MYLLLYVFIGFIVGSITLAYSKVHDNSELECLVIPTACYWPAFVAFISLYLLSKWGPIRGLFKFLYTLGPKQLCNRVLYPSLVFSMNKIYTLAERIQSSPGPLEMLKIPCKVSTKVFSHIKTKENENLLPKAVVRNLKY